MTVAKTVIAKPTPKGKIVALVIKKSEKVPADSFTPKATNGGKKQKMSVVGDEKRKKQIVLTNLISTSSWNVWTIPPVKKKDIL